MKSNVFGIYKGDKFITVGTADECATVLKVKPQTVKFYASPTYQNRNKEDGNALVVFRLEEDEE